jgi:hypothetical protein
MMLCAAGCASVPKPEPWTEAESAAIAAKCHAPDGLLVVENGNLRVRHNPDLSYDLVACILGEIQATPKKERVYITASG